MKIDDLKMVSKETMQVIGAELKRRRIYKATTLVNLSSICSISYISKIENGKIIPKLHVLQELCEEQGISKEELDTLRITLADKEEELNRLTKFKEREVGVI